MYIRSIIPSYHVKGSKRRALLESHYLFLGAAVDIDLAVGVVPDVLVNDGDKLLVAVFTLFAAAVGGMDRALKLGRVNQELE